MNFAFHNYSSAKKNTTNESNMDIVLYIAECVFSKSLVFKFKNNHQRFFIEIIYIK